MIVLFLNHNKKQCGVYQYGKRVYDIIKNDTKINYIYEEVGCEKDYLNILNETKMDVIIYNFVHATMPWLNIHNMPSNIKKIGLKHEFYYNESLFDNMIDINPINIETARISTIPRPIFENIDEILLNNKSSSKEVEEFINIYTDSNIPIFGSFGFGFTNKGFDKIVSLVNEQYDNAVIKYVIPVAHFDPNPNRTVEMRNRIMSITRKPGIILMITHIFFSNEDLLRFLKSNTMNIFLYDYMEGRGPSSTLDYALSVKKPIGISDSFMFRHIYSDSICLYKTTIKDCIKNSSEYYSPFLETYSHKNMIEKFNKVLHTIVQ
jgi:hypothetical protein